MIRKESDEVSSLSNLVLDYQKNRDIDLLDRICKESFPIVEARASFFSRSYPVIMEDESFSDGCFALITDIISNYKIKKLKSGKLCNFETYLRWRLRGAMLDGLRKRDHLSRTQRKKLNNLRDAKSVHEVANGMRNYSIEELAAMTNESEKSVKHTLKLDKGIQFSLSQENSEMSTLASNLTSPLKGPLDEVVNNDLLEKTYEFMQQKLPNNYTEAIYLYYAWGLKLREIGSIQNVSESRIGQIIAKGRERIRDHLSK